MKNLESKRLDIYRKRMAQLEDQGGVNSKRLIEFANACITANISMPTTLTKVRNLENLLAIVGKDYSKTNQKDMEKIVSEINLMDRKISTKLHYKIALRQFIDWNERGIKAFTDTDEVSQNAKWIKIKIPNRLKIPPHSFPTEKQVWDLLEHCRTPQERAIIISLYDSGARAGEFLGMQIRDLKLIYQDKKLNHIMFNIRHSKTAAREIALTISRHYMEKYLAEHPDKNNPDAPLWVNMRGTPLDRECLTKLIAKIAARAGLYEKRVYHSGIKPDSSNWNSLQDLFIKGDYQVTPDIKEFLNKLGLKWDQRYFLYMPKTGLKLNPHKFRHARATVNSAWQSYAQMCYFFGWTLGSDMPKIYIHLSGEMVNNAVLAFHGLGKSEEVKYGPDGKPTRSTTASYKICPSCGNNSNAPEILECAKCGFNLLVGGGTEPLHVALNNEAQDIVMEKYKEGGPSMDIIMSLLRKTVEDNEKLHKRLDKMSETFNQSDVIDVKTPPLPPP